MWGRLPKLLIIMLLFEFSLNAAELEICKVIRIIDGDTVEVIYRDEKEKVRLYGIDTPELGELGFEEATNATKHLIDGKYVYLSFPTKHKRDNFGRLLANIFLYGSSLVNKVLVEEGYAKLYKSTTLEELNYYDNNNQFNERLLIQSIILNNDIELLKYFYNPKSYTMSEEHRIKILNIALMLSSEKSTSPEMITALINLGADINIKFAKTTPLHVAACLNPNPSIITKLLQYGTDINAKNNKGHTPLDLARDAKNTPAITTLIKAGAQHSY